MELGHRSSVIFDYMVDEDCHDNSNDDEACIQYTIAEINNSVTNGTCH